MCVLKDFDVSLVYIPLSHLIVITRCRQAGTPMLMSFNTVCAHYTG
jgi:hypothetical protein